MGIMSVQCLFLSSGKDYLLPFITFARHIWSLLKIMEHTDIILGIESSCDDTSAAVIKDGYLLSNVIASQQVHKDYGGVVPELASRAHEQNIVPVVSQALEKAGVKPEELTAIAFTRGPGLLGSLLVGTSFAKALSVSLGIPMVMVNHLQGHILADFVKQYDKENHHPEFPYLCLLVSGGNSQIVKVNSPLDYEILGQTIDDAVGEAFDKCSKMMGLGYPGGPIIDKLANLVILTVSSSRSPISLGWTTVSVASRLLSFISCAMRWPRILISWKRTRRISVQVSRKH